MSKINKRFYLSMVIVCIVLAQGCAPSVKSRSAIALAPGMDLSIFKQQVIDSTDQSIHSTVTDVNGTGY